MSDEKAITSNVSSENGDVKESVIGLVDAQISAHSSAYRQTIRTLLRCRNLSGPETTVRITKKLTVRRARWFLKAEYKPADRL